ncbi:MAG: tRNA uridine(34) 5-carboxymethylaminomethyl modification radical SAM/GNAT enzyme Elp3 [Chloroflexi bacterium]|nr:tRNA uridine(34) 5-carboxymethylaminomethyl modification radical SAM/GNAT enzyme Elp3 [Chloroflexota bacterium]
MENRQIHWQNSRQYSQEQLEVAGQVLDEIIAGQPTLKSIRSHPLSKGGYIAKHVLVYVYRQRVDDGLMDDDPVLLARIRMKPVRSLSGVSTVTVLTEPYTCPGSCLFCPDEQGLPKSYLKEEPGAARAYQNQFDPYLQVRSRLDSYLAIGHPINKIELLILGGSWSAYPADYREWFIRRCFDAMNGHESETLVQAHSVNESSDCRNVGLVVETRPDMITPKEIAFMRELGVTKVQMGAQSLNNEILAINCRGHNVEDTLNAVSLLRAAGFKVVLHWMPNLLGATMESDKQDFQKLWNDGFSPDEIKIYPTQLVKEAPLYNIWEQGDYSPYTTEQLIHLIADIKPGIPEYCRVNRIIRDIPADYIIAGSRRSSLRQDVHRELDRRGQRCRCIRCREIKGKAIDPDALIDKDLVYETADSQEHFLSFSTEDDRLAGYLRLSFPILPTSPKLYQDHEELFQQIPELKGAALIREIHVYGQSLEIGADQLGAAQHIGLGSTLLERAEKLSREAGYKKLAVIAAVGTRLYYQDRGFQRENLYMTRKIA